MLLLSLGELLIEGVDIGLYGLGVGSGRRSGSGSIFRISHCVCAERKMVEREGETDIV